jgi:peptide deformylase
MIRTITQLGNPILRQIAAPVIDFSETALKGLIDDLFETLAATGGVGIAAPQIGESVRVAIVASEPNERYPHAPSIGPIILINPVVEWQSEEREKGWEGCLSVPGIRGIVPRPVKIRVRFTEYKTGKTILAEAEGFTARVILHETDHLDGTVFVDRIESTRDLATEQEYRRIVTGTAEPEPEE